MKLTCIVFITYCFLLFTSCAKLPYYQVYKVIPSETLTQKENSLVFEDSSCKVYYNLYEEGGNAGFRFYNKTTKNIYLNLGESFFIMNGHANNYYMHRTITNTKSIGVSSSQSTYYYQPYSYGIGSASGSSTSYEEESIVCIPPLSFKKVYEYKINTSVIQDCDLDPSPSKKKIKNKSYIKSNSPFVFTNMISYSTGKTDEPIRIVNEFYISEMTNYPQSAAFETIYPEKCGHKSSVAWQQFKFNKADQFFVKYFEK